MEHDATPMSLAGGNEHKRVAADRDEHANELNFQLTVDSIPGMVHTMTPTGGVEFVSHQILDYFGKTLDELNDWGALLHPDDRARVIDRWTHSVATGEPYDTEHRVLRADGTYGWLHSRGLPLRDVSGNIVRWYNLLTDIDERKRAEEALRESEHESRLIVDTIPGLVALLTPAGDVEFGNHQLLEYCGQTLEALKQWDTNGTVHPEDLGRVVQIFTHGLTSGEPYEFEARLRRFDGTYRWFQARGLPLRDTSDHIARWYVLLTDIDDRKHAEEAVAASEGKLKLTIDTVPALAWSALPDGSADFLNQHYLDFIGLSAEQASGWNWASAVHPDDLAQLTATWQRFLALGEGGEAEARLRRRDGQYRWFLFRANPLRDGKGNIVKWYGVNTDIEDRKRTEQDLRRSETFLAQAQRVTRTGSLWWKVSTGEITWSDESFRLMGYPNTVKPTVELILNRVHPEDFQMVRETVERSAREGSNMDFEHRLLMPDGSVKHVHVVVQNVSADGQPPEFAGAVRDITERKRVEGELRRSEAFLIEAQQISRLGSFSYLQATGEITWSEQIYRIFEVEFGVRPTFELIRARVHPEDLSTFDAEIVRQHSERNDSELDVRLLMPDKRLKYIHIVSHCQGDPGQLDFNGAIQDVTQRRLAEDALAKVRSELASVARVTSLGVLTASIAHEVNQPLAGIMTNASTCLRMLGSVPPNIDGARETAKRTIRDADRASDVITRLRSLFNKKELALESLDLNEVTREVIALSLSDLQRHRVILQSEFADDLPIVSGDRIQLQQVMLNLIRNASDAMSDVSDRPRNLLIKTEREDSERVRVTVRDSGIGIARQDLESLFDAFYTTKASGMGVGLFVSRSIVEKHHGRLWADLNDGPGATFSFSMPVQSA